MKKIALFFILLLCPVFILAENKIDINTATLSQLDELTGIGPKYAQAIIEARPFSLVDDLDKVKGIGPATLQKIKEQGLACVNCSTTSNVVIPAKAGIQGEGTDVDSGLRQNDTTPVAYPAGIFINEILPNPAGADETEEWIELYNQNNFEVDLSGWSLQDLNGAPKTYSFLQNTKILANGFLVLKRTETKIMLNNDSDGINLLSPDEKISDSASFKSAPLGQSYNKISSGWTWSSTLTPGTVNIVFLGKKDLPKAKTSAKNNIVEAGIANISQATEINQDNKQIENPWFLFYAALAMAIISALFILFIKFKIS